MAETAESGRKLRAKERKHYTDEDIDEDDIDGKRNYNVEEKLLRNNYTGDFVQVMKGEEFNMKFMQENGLKNPIVFYDKTGLGMRVPSENFQVSDVKQCVGSRRMLDVMDVNTQKGMEMSMKEWVRYYTSPSRDRLLNVISLEFSHTRLENYVESPTLVRQVDWVDRVWPRHLKECQTEATNIIDKMKYPKVQKYCLMSVKGCYTDFHIDFGGTSVWYHILHGEKVFWLIPPTQDNVERYVNWVLSAKQGDYFLADHMDQCQMIRLKAGYTFIIPSGWIHAVYTPVDSLVFGGNFLHSFNIPNQLLVAQVEDRTHVPQKFRYPFYNEILWYVLDRYLWCLTGKTYLQKPDIKEEDDRPDSPASMQIDDDSRPPSRNPDSRPPSRNPDESLPTDSKVKVEGEDTPKLSKSITIELTRIDDALKSSLTDDEHAKRLSRKCASDPTLSDALSREETEAGTDCEEKENSVKTEGEGAESKPKRAACLTSWEIDGLRRLIKWVEGLNALPLAKRGIPRDLLDPEALLQDIKVALKEHENDSQAASCTGEPVLGWPESVKKIKPRIKSGYGSSSKSKTPKEKGSSSAVRRRRTRCKKCEACTRTECGECTFCKDMRKFGGPGRMKQSCVSRQCMAPILPHTAVCLICGLAKRSDEDPADNDDDNPTASLMECGICWEICHPQCLRDSFESAENDGVINEDLPSSWECLKCVNAGKQGQLKTRIIKVCTPKPAPIEQPRSVATSERSTPSPPITTPSQALTPLKMDDDEGTTSPVEGKRVTAKEGQPLKKEKGPHKTDVSQMGKKEKLLRKAIKRTMEKTKSEVKQSTKTGTPPPSRTFTTKSSSPSPSSSTPRGDRPAKRELEKERASPADRGDASSSKRPRRELQGGSRERDFDTDSGRDSRGQSPSLKKLRPRRERNPEDEASGSGSRTSPTPGHSRWEGRRLHDDNKPGSSRHSGGGGGLGLTNPGPSRGASSRGGTPDKLAQPGGSGGQGSACKQGGQEGGMATVTDRDPQALRPKFVVRPPDLPPAPDQVMLDAGRPHPLGRVLWMRVFSFLRPADLARCLQVCKAWNRWSIHHSLWRRINLARTTIKQAHLCGTALRQPRSLDLTNAAVSYKQLAWLVARLPQLKELNLSGQPWATVCALCSPNTPLLRRLTISWATGVHPPCFEELVEPPIEVKPGITPNLSRLHQLRYLDLSGTEVNDSSLGIISGHLGLLEVLNLTCCMRITDTGLEALARQGSPLLLSLQVLSLIRCLGLTDKCFVHLTSFQRLRSLNVSKIPHISRNACSRFVQQYTYRQLAMTVPGIFSVAD